MTTTYTLEDKILAIKRELGLRKRVYPRWASIGKMTHEKASFEIGVMQAILSDLQNQDKTLFNTCKP